MLEQEDMRGYSVAMLDVLENKAHKAHEKHVAAITEKASSAEIADRLLAKRIDELRSNFGSTSRVFR